MFVLIPLLSLLATASSSPSPAPPQQSASPGGNFHAGNCVFYWVPDLLENTPMKIEIYDAMENPLCPGISALLPSWANDEAHVLICDLDRWIGIQSQPNNEPAMFAYGSNTRISLDPTHLSPINTTLGSNGDMPNPGECAWPLAKDSLHPDSTDLMKCAFSCGPGY